MRLKLVTGPATEPVTLDEAKAQCRVDISDDDTFISGLIAAAREYFEEAGWRALITQTWRLNLDDWPEGEEIELPRPPLQSVDSLVYLDEDGDSTTWDAANYIVDTDSEPGRVVLANEVSWPGVDLYPANPIRVTFVAGYGDAADVPQRYKQGILLLVGHWYEHREDTIEATIRNIPLGVESLIWLDRGY